MERFSLAHADRLIWQGGDILGAYRRFYGEAGLAPAVRIRYPYRGPHTDPAADRGREPSSVLELVCPGRLERRKGVWGLVRAACSLGREDFRLRLVGGDTGTGPLGVSMREVLELEAAGDPRVVLEAGDGVGRELLASRVRGADVVVIPSLWECWPYTALEALHLNRPVLATPVGGLVEMVGGEGCAGGWLAPGTGWRDLAVALERVLDSRARLVELVGGGGLVSRASTLADGPGIVEGYAGLVAGGVRRGSGVRSRPGPEDRVPLVSAIVPYYRSARFVSQTIASLLEQTYPRLEIVLVNDGSFEEEDRVLAQLATRFPIVVISQTNTGLGAARNFGISQSRGRYFFPLDADNLAEPEFVQRCVEILEARPEVAYVTSWSRYIDEHGTPRPARRDRLPAARQPRPRTARRKQLRRRRRRRHPPPPVRPRPPLQRRTHQLRRLAPLPRTRPRRTPRNDHPPTPPALPRPHPTNASPHRDPPPHPPPRRDQRPHPRKCGPMDVVERLTLEVARSESLIACEHRHRYQFAARVCEGLRVADLCCGSGYGAELLAPLARAVVGVDNDAATIDTARLTVGRLENVDFELADALVFLQRDLLEDFELLVCFEGLEHLPDPERALALLRDHARRGLKLIVSVPNSRMFEEDNPFHLTAFGYDEALRAFEPFSGVAMLPQFLAEGSVILPAGAQGVEVDLHLEDRNEPEYANHFIFCVNFDPAVVAGAHHAKLQVAAAPLFNRFAEGIKHANQALARENARLARERLGAGGSGAASGIAAVPQEAARLESERAAWEDQARLAEARVIELEEELTRARLAAARPSTAGYEAAPPVPGPGVNPPPAAPADLSPPAPGEDPNSWNQRHRRAAQHLIPWIEQAYPLAGKTVLEYGCGNGAVTCAVAAHAGRVIGLDIDARWIDEAVARARERGLGNVELELHPPEAILDAAAATPRTGGRAAAVRGARAPDRLRATAGPVAGTRARRARRRDRRLRDAEPADLLRSPHRADAVLSPAAGRAGAGLLRPICSPGLPRRDRRRRGGGPGLRARGDRPLGARGQLPRVRAGIRRAARSPRGRVQLRPVAAPGAPGAARRGDPRALPRALATRPSAGLLALLARSDPEPRAARTPPAVDQALAAPDRRRDRRRLHRPRDRAAGGPGAELWVSPPIPPSGCWSARRGRPAS